jgi:hypothetical protein
MLLFQKRFHAGLQSGAVTLTYRRWQTARVKVGGRYRCHPIGVLEVDEVRKVRVGDISRQDAKLAGFESREELVEYISSVGRAALDDDTELFRVGLHHGGDGDRVSIALDDDLSENDIEAIQKKLARMDTEAPWTLKTLRLIERNPKVAARILAKKLDRQRDPFKVDVRKLKRLGLTQSFEVGYEISPRGRAFLAAVTTAGRRKRG